MSQGSPDRNQGVKVLLILFLFLLTGCATGVFTKPADTVKFPRGEAFKVYSDIRVAYALTKYKIELACQAAKLGPQLCQIDLPRQHEEMQRVDRRIMEALANPAVEVDWEAVGEAVRIVVKLAGAVL